VSEHLKALYVFEVETEWEEDSNGAVKVENCFLIVLEVNFENHSSFHYEENATDFDILFPLDYIAL
jgi:hypothetical protein